MGCCHSTDNDGKVRRVSSSDQHLALSQLDLMDKDVSAMKTIIQNTHRSDSVEDNCGIRESEFFPQRAVKIHLKAAARLPNLDFSITNAVTGGLAVEAARMVGAEKRIEDVSDPYVLFAVGEAGVEWSLRQHQGPIVKSKTIYDDLNPVWNELLEIRVAEDLDNPELHVMLYDSDVTLGGVINFEDDFLGELRIPIQDDGTHDLTMLKEYSLMGELALKNHSTVTMSWEYAHTSNKTTSNKVQYCVTAVTGEDSYVSAGTKQPVYAMFIGDLGATPLLCLQDSCDQVLLSSTATHWQFEWENIGRPLYIAVQLGNSTKEHCWGLEKLHVSRYGKMWTFPFYSWLYSGKPAAVVFEGTAYTSAEMKEQELYHTLQSHKLYDHSKHLNKIDVNNRPIPHHTSGLRVRSIKFKKDRINLTAEEGEKKCNDEDAVNNAIREGRRMSSKTLMESHNYEQVLLLMENRNVDQKQRIERLLNYFTKANQQQENAVSALNIVIDVTRANPQTKSRKIKLDDHDPLEDPSENLHVWAKEHFRRASDALQKHGGEYNDAMYEPYDHEGNIISSAAFAHEDFQQHNRDVLEPLKENLRPLDIKPEERYITLLVARDIEIKTHRQEYPWAKDMYMQNKNADWRMLPGQIHASGKYGPIHSKNLPVPERFANDKQSDYFWNGVRGLANLYLSKFVGKFHPFSHFDDVVTLFRNIPYPDVYLRWKEDEEFARQAVQGYDPAQIRRWVCTSENADVTKTALYTKFPVTDIALGWKKGRLIQLWKEHKLYYIDFHMLENMECWDDLPPKKFHTNGKRPRYCAASIALFYVDEENKGMLMPAAIQLSQDPNVSPIFAPKVDTELDWLLAKMLVQNSGANLHQMISHAMKTHLISEPFVIAAERNLAHCHPLYKILKRHTRYTLAINTKARNGLIDAGGIFDEFISNGGGGHIKLAVECYKSWTLHTNNLKKDLLERGVNDKDKLPYYPYRDDGLLVWNAMEEYIGAVVENHYKTDKDIMADTELQNFAMDVLENGHTSPQFDIAMASTKQNVVEMITTIVWTVSCQHSAMNFGQYKYLGFPLNAPMSIYVDPKFIKKKQYDSEKLIMQKIMPSQHQIIKQISIAYILAA
jgi:hypothetical protein